LVISSPRTILHVDMDAFYASVEQRDDPSLRGRPVIVGGSSRRGVVLAASYEARPSGARSAMPMGEALRRCPDALVVPPRMRRYAEVSAEVFEVFRRFTPLVEGLSIDEAFLDVTASRSLFGEGPAIAARIKAAIRAELGLTASAGVAPTKFVAKIASDLDKPDGLVVVLSSGVGAFLAGLPIERMWGVGPKTAPRLRQAGFVTFADLAGAPPGRLEALVGKAGAAHIQALAQGLDARDVNPEREAGSIGAEETFEHDLTDRRSLELRLLELAGRVARRLMKAGQSTRTVTVKVKYADFSRRSRSATLPDAVADTGSLFRAAKALFDRAPPGPVRLLGISAGALVEGAVPGTRSLFTEGDPERGRRLEQVVASVAERFGGRGLRRAALLELDEEQGHGDEGERSRG
jgi:DNA polymerase-4